MITGPVQLRRAIIPANAKSQLPQLANVLLAAVSGQIFRFGEKSDIGNNIKL